MGSFILICRACRRCQRAASQGIFKPDVTGDYQFQTFSNCGIKLWIDNQLGRLTIGGGKAGLPWNDLVRPTFGGWSLISAFDSGWGKDQGMPNVRLLWKTPSRRQPLQAFGRKWAVAASIIIFSMGESIDNVVAGYRRVTGNCARSCRSGRWVCGNHASDMKHAPCELMSSTASARSHPLRQHIAGLAFAGKRSPGDRISSTRLDFPIRTDGSMRSMLTPHLIVPVLEAPSGY